MEMMNHLQMAEKLTEMIKTAKWTSHTKKIFKKAWGSPFEVKTPFAVC